MRNASVALLVIAVALSGCADDADTGPDGPTSAECLEQGLILDEMAEGGPACVEPPFEIRNFEDPQHHCVVTEQRDRIHAPDLIGDPWVLGQSWTYRLTVDGEDLGPTQLVYYDDQDPNSAGIPQHYMVGTPTRDEALHHALFGANPMIGRVHAILYSPHESGDHADMFHFPLCDGSTWNTAFYGETFSLTAREVTPSEARVGPATGGRAFLIEGNSAQGGTLALSYSTAAQWFTFIDLDRGDGGTVDMQLEAMAAGYSGQAFFLRGQKDAVIEVSGLELEGVVEASLPTVHEQVLPREDGNDGPYDTIGFHVEANATGAVAIAQLTIQGPSGADVYTAQFATGVEDQFGPETFEVPYEAGNWVVTLQGAALGASDADLYVNVRAVSIYDRSGAV